MHFGLVCRSKAFVDIHHIDLRSDQQKDARSIVGAVTDVPLEMPALLFEALKRAPLPSTATCVREAIALYESAA